MGMGSLNRALLPLQAVQIQMKRSHTAARAKFFPLLLGSLCAAFAASAIADPKTSVPAFADFAGVRVGLDTMQRLEKQLGPGKPVKGGHPLGGREWRTSRPRAIIYADGFNSFDRD